MFYSSDVFRMPGRHVNIPSARCLREQKLEQFVFLLIKVPKAEPHGGSVKACFKNVFRMPDRQPVLPSAGCRSFENVCFKETYVLQKPCVINHSSNQ